MVKCLASYCFTGLPIPIQGISANGVRGINTTKEIVNYKISKNEENLELQHRGYKGKIKN